MSVFKPRSFWVAVVGIALCTFIPTASAAISPLDPGDVLFTEFFDGWKKLNPVTGQVTQLPWRDPNNVEHIAFDTDGAILFDSGDSINRLNPTTGAVTRLNVPNLLFQDGFVVEANGDLLIANSGEIARFSRTSHTTSRVTGGTFFSPNGIARGADGRVFATEFFQELWEIFPASGTRSHVTSAGLTIPSLIAVRSDGDLIVKNFSPSLLYRINPNTRAVSLFSSDLPTFVHGIALDASDNLWMSSTDGIYRYASGGGAKSLIATGTFFNPEAITVVPLNWAFPVPEPASEALLVLASVGVPLRRCRTFCRRERRVSSRTAGRASGSSLLR
jgi:streptogramin lyase